MGLEALDLVDEQRQATPVELLQPGLQLDLSNILYVNTNGAEVSVGERTVGPAKYIWIAHDSGLNMQVEGDTNYRKVEVTDRGYDVLDLVSLTGLSPAIISGGVKAPEVAPLQYRISNGEEPMNAQEISLSELIRKVDPYRVIVGTSDGQRHEFANAPHVTIRNYDP